MEFELKSGNIWSPCSIRFLTFNPAEGFSSSERESALVSPAGAAPSAVSTGEAASASLTDKTVYSAKQLRVCFNTGVHTNSRPPPDQSPISTHRWRWWWWRWGGCSHISGGATGAPFHHGHVPRPRHRSALEMQGVIYQHVEVWLRGKFKRKEETSPPRAGERASERCTPGR